MVLCGVTCGCLLEECVDMRKELCYLSYTDGHCSQPMTNEQTRMLCCCSMGQAWGHPCQPCPADKTSEYAPQLCNSHLAIQLFIVVSAYMTSSEQFPITNKSKCVLFKPFFIKLPMLCSL